MLKYGQKVLSYLGFEDHKRAEPANTKRRDVNEEELRKLYNDSGFEEKVKRGELQELEESKRHIEQEILPTKCRYCANSKVSKLIDSQTNDEVAILHWYENSDDGSIGASGKRDPKYLVLNGVEYHKARTRKQGALTPRKNRLVKTFRDWYRARRFEFEVAIGRKPRPPKRNR